jgi:hypothetical protein
VVRTYDKHNTRDTYLHICIVRAAAGGGYVKAPKAPGIHVKKLPFAEVSGFTVSLPADLKSTIGSLAALELN